MLKNVFKSTINSKKAVENKDPPKRPQKYQGSFYLKGKPELFGHDH